MFAGVDTESWNRIVAAVKVFIPAVRSGKGYGNEKAELISALNDSVPLTAKPVEVLMSWLEPSQITAKEPAVREAIERAIKKSMASASPDAMTTATTAPAPTSSKAKTALKVGGAAAAAFAFAKIAKII